MNPDAPLDELDAAILQRISSIHAALDAPPPDLDERVAFALAFGELEVEVARLAEAQLVAARGAERTRTITFEGAGRSVMVSIVDRPDHLVRVDGWLAPGAPLRVELRMPEPAPARWVVADAAGRFVFEGVPHGLAQLLVHPATDAEGPTLVTPSLVL